MDNLERFVWPARQRVMPDRRPRVSASRLSGAAMIAIILSLLAYALSLMAAGARIVPGDVWFTNQVQSLPPTPTSQLAWLTNELGTTSAMLALSGLTFLILLARGLHLAALVILTSVMLRVINPALKIFWDSPRPTADLVRVTETDPGNGFPSGHTMGAVLLWGTLAVLAPKIIPWKPGQRLLQGFALTFILLTGLGRIYVGAHWPTDVLGAYLYGAIVLIGLFTGLQFAQAQAPGLSQRWQEIRGRIAETFERPQPALIMAAVRARPLFSMVGFLMLTTLAAIVVLD